MTYSMYVCDACNELFYEPFVRHEREKEEFWGEPVVYTIRIEMCPACGREDIREVAECEDCGLAPAMDGYDVCGTCQMKREAGERLAETLVDIGMTRVTT